MQAAIFGYGNDNVSGDYRKIRNAKAAFRSAGKSFAFALLINS
jgi:hypothetical protein